MAALLATTAAHAQWLNYIGPDVPMKNGKPNLSAPAPRATDGKPDLSGVWLHERTSDAEMKRLFSAFAAELDASPIGMEADTAHKTAMNILVDKKPGEVELTPAGEAAMKKRNAERDPSNVCHGEYGWPVAGLLTEPFKIVQTPRLTLVLYEIDSLRRQIFADGRKFPATVEFPAYLGYSIGRWEGDTFVVETRGFNDRTPLDAMGHPRSENLKVTERYHRPNFGRLIIDYTYEDPELYTKPITVTIPYSLVADNDIFEMFCSQNEKDKAHMVK